ncbi:ATP-dependent DNA ligase [Micromonospora zhanjiangensis]|uniref:ATP-dependent DNA ligase family profile domain-containing protein n=1 Tax=Micromonospora zhanjiangensis TaxID=1522057 RepID=A0ABV8KV61_9ACTN
MSPAQGPASVATGPVLRRPVTPMLATPVDAVPEGSDLVHQPEWDRWRCIAFRQADGVYLQSRAGRDLTTYFPDITRAIRMLPPGVVLDGELMVWQRGRTNFAAPSTFRRRTPLLSHCTSVAARWECLSVANRWSNCSWPRSRPPR